MRLTTFVKTSVGLLGAAASAGAAALGSAAHSTLSPLTQAPDDFDEISMLTMGIIIGGLTLAGALTTVGCLISQCCQGNCCDNASEEERESLLRQA